MALPTVLLIHSDTVTFFSFAFASIARRCSAVKRTGTMRPLAALLGSVGRPTLLALGIVPVLLNNGRSHCCLWRYGWWNMKHCYMATFAGFGFMRPRIDSVRFWMADQIKNFDNSIPHRFPLVLLFYGYALDVRCFHAVKLHNHISQFLNMAHADASTRSPTLKKSRSIPAAIAGVQRRVL